MKTITNILFVTLLFGFILSSCEIDKSVNIDPNNTSEENAQSIDGVYSLFVGLQVNVGDTYSRDRSRLFSIWSWQMCAPAGIARPQPVEWNEYQVTSDGPPDDYWVITYRGVKIANDLIKFTPKVFIDTNIASVNSILKGNAIIGISKIYKALLLGEAAATWGSIPIEIIGSEPPDFVDQQTAYAYVQSLLDDAITDLSKGTGPVTRDLNFQGNAAKWIAVANSLKARFYLHIGDYSKALVASNSGIVNSSGSIYGIYSDKAGEKAQWGMWVKDEKEAIRGEKFLVDLLKSEAGDKRLTDYFLPNSTGKFFGYAIHDKSKYPIPFDTNERKLVQCVRMKKYSTYSEKFPLIRYEENVLIKAECEARTNQIPASVANINIIRTQNGLTAFSGTDPVAVMTEALKQKFLELYLEGQAWHDMRRIGTLPDAFPYNGSFTNLRFIYGESEKNANKKVPLDVDALCKWLLNVKYGGLNP